MRAAAFSMSLIALLVFTITAKAEPTITIYTDAGAYQSGQTAEVSLSAQNDGEALAVAVYVGIVLQDGEMWSVQSDGWQHAIGPWIPYIDMPASFEMGRTPFWMLDLSCEAPPISRVGDYCFVATLMYPETFDLVSMTSLSPFSFEAGGSTEITMLSIPAGSFLMGSPSNELDHDEDEDPQRTVNISAFLMSETEVTQKQFRDVLGWNDSHFRGDDLPVEEVTWYDCVSFCNELSEADGYATCYTITDIDYEGDHINSADVACNSEANGYRLPTEAEWEYACRAGTTTRFCTGDSDSDLDRAGWFSSNSGRSTHAVGEKEANAWGLYDTHGNVFEWCWDWYSSGYYGTRPDPDTDPTGPSSGYKRSRRGGCWYGDALFSRSADRYGYRPHSSFYYLGFRVVRSVN